MDIDRSIQDIVLVLEVGMVGLSTLLNRGIDCAREYYLHSSTPSTYIPFIIPKFKQKIQVPFLR